MSSGSLYKWDSTGITKEPLNISLYNGYYGTLVLNNSEISIIFQKWYYSDTATLVTYDKNIKIKTIALPAGKFRILDLFYLNTKLYVRMYADSNALISYKKMNEDTLISIENSIVLASIEDTVLYIKKVLRNISDYNVNYQMPNSTSKIYWSFDGNALRKITDDTVASLKYYPGIPANFILNKEKLFTYNSTTRKIIRLDNLLGFCLSTVFRY